MGTRRQHTIRRAGQYAVLAEEETRTYPATAEWEGVIGVEGTMTGDGRLIEPDALRWEVPFPIRIVRSDVGGHDGAEVAGTCTHLERREGGLLWGRGPLDMGGEPGREAYRVLKSEVMNGISMDLDDVSFEIRVAREVMDDLFADPIEEEGGEDSIPAEDVDDEGRVTIMKMDPDDEVMVTTDARVRAATLVAIPAFVEAKVHVVDAVDSMNDEDTNTGDGESLAAYPAGDAGGVLAVDGVGLRPEAEWSATRLHRSGRAWRETTAGAPCRLGEFAGSDPRGPDAGSSVQEHAVLQSRAHGAGDGGGERGAVQPGSCFTAAGDVWVWAPVHRSEHAPGDAPTEGWFHVPDADVSGVLAASPARVVASEPREVTASAAPARPPREWFADPKLPGPTPFTVTPEGRVYGHLALWGTCHTTHAMEGECLEPPSSQTGYAHFRTGAVLTDDGTEVAVGRITVNTSHPDTKAGRLTPQAVTMHYDNTGSQAAYVAAGEDQFGIWVAGTVKPGATREQVDALRASPLSGDWRRVGNSLELLAVLAVNGPGFPVPRPSGLVASGRLVALTASSGMLPPTTETFLEDDRLSEADINWLKHMANRERMAHVSELAGRVKQARTAAAARKVRAFAARRN